MAENRSKSQEAATLLRRAASILTQNSAESEGCCACYSPCTIGLTIAALFINLRRSTVEEILGDKRVLLSHKISGHTRFFLFGQTPQVAR
jgi:hypothetical protein